MKRLARGDGAAQRVERLACRRRAGGGHLPALEDLGEDAPVGRVVVHHERADRPQVERGRRGRIGVLVEVEPHDEVELTADAWLALEPETAAHHLDELRRDGETEAGAAESACRRGVGLDERPEDLPPLVLGNPDAGIPHRAAEHHGVVLVALGRR